jgi:hypothetical protein
MSWYKASRGYRGSSWREPIVEGDIIRATPEQAAQLNRCSPGLLVPFEVAEKEPVKIVKIAAPAAPTHRAAPVSPRSK